MVDPAWCSWERRNSLLAYRIRSRWRQCTCSGEKEETAAWQKKKIITKYTVTRSRKDTNKTWRGFDLSGICLHQMRNLSTQANRPTSPCSTLYMLFAYCACRAYHPSSSCVFSCVILSLPPFQDARHFGLTCPNFVGQFATKGYAANLVSSCAT